jgi:hypothetical protein
VSNAMADLSCDIRKEFPTASARVRDMTTR